MTTNAIIIFIVFNILNVVIQTIKSIATIKCGKNMAALINAIAYGLYTYIVVLTASDGVSLWFKIVVVALANLVGVWVVKFVEEKGRKDKLWKVEATVAPSKVADLSRALEQGNVPYNCFTTSGEYRIFNIFCATQKESVLVKKLLDFHRAKYFVSESKTL
jgi:uncharacterized protein YebE (UPF0316 family)